MGVYPRTGGETCQLSICCEDSQGLSPHRRGNRCLPRDGPIDEGSIPAQAGKPDDGEAMFTSKGVYPRTGGET